MTIELENKDQNQTFESSGPAVDIVVPVYGSIELAIKCIDSILASHPKTPYNLIVIDDGSPDASVAETLEEMSKTKRFRLIRNSANLGFPATCNIGFKLNRNNDVVLVNSDVEVFGNWLDRLVEVGRSRQEIGTVTPITNNGEICSYPKWLENNDADLEVPPYELDKLAGEVNAGLWVDSPTGVGFCMFFKRECLEQVGGFNEIEFKKGYGEENDFSQRAKKVGWINAITPSVYVTHKGGGSFGDSKASLIVLASKKMHAMHPSYFEDVQSFLERNPLSDSFERLDKARLIKHSNARAVLLITHNWGGGTERHIQECLLNLTALGTPVLIMRPLEDNSEEFVIESSQIAPLPNLKPIKVSLPPKDFLNHLTTLGVSYVQIHNLAGYSNAMPEYLADALGQSNIGYDFVAHDYQYWCPRINLVGITGIYCGEPSTGSCQRCVETLWTAFGSPIIWKWRKSYEQLLRGATAIIAPSEDVAARIVRHLPGARVTVKPHEKSSTIPIEITLRKPNNLSSKQAGKKELKIGLIGSFGPEKGSKVLEFLATHLLENDPDVKFVVFGGTDRNESLKRLGNVRLKGRYEESKLTEIIKKEEFDLIWFPGVAPETYSYTLSAALASNVPLAAFDIGAISKRISDANAGLIADLKISFDAPELIRHLRDAAGINRTHRMNFAAATRDVLGKNIS